MGGPSCTAYSMKMLSVSAAPPAWACSMSSDVVHRDGQCVQEVHEQRVGVASADRDGVRVGVASADRDGVRVDTCDDTTVSLSH
jgi:hypothetical protein